ncbi:hypothetical protein JW930_06400 [Candidatus Woesearchaeota archaeon]|nr:hypothetical protein [Candidatus Woesearchaeota archaeon]
MVNKGYFLSFLIIIPLTYASFSLSEIMYNPDDNNEWIELELFNITPQDFFDLTITDNYYQDQLDFCFPQDITNAAWILIVDQDSTLYGSVDMPNIVWLCVDDNSIGNGLGNEGDTINISSGRDNILFFEYNQSTKKGNSLALINDSWIEAAATPGKKNQEVINILNNEEDHKDIELKVWLDEFLIIGVEQNGIFKLTNTEHVSGQQDAISVYVYYNITNINKLYKEDLFNISVNYYTTSNTGSFLFNESGNYTVCGEIISSSANDTNLNNNKECKNITVVDTLGISCDISLFLETEKLIYNEGEKISFYNILNNETFPYSIEYWVTDLFDYIVKEKYITKNTNKKSFTPSINGPDQVLILRSNLTFVACNDTNKEDNYQEKILVIKGFKQSGSEIDIEEIYLGEDNKAKFGETIRVKVRIYKGNTTKNSVRAWVEKDTKVSYVTYYNLYTDFMEYVITIPILIKPNCNENYEDGKYKVIIEGLEESDWEYMRIEGITSSLCKKSTKPASTSEQEKSIEEFELMDFVDTYGVDEVVKLKININNEDSKKHDYSIWSYVYRGPKCYSGEREQNKVSISLKSGENKIIELCNTLLNVSPGEYSVKIKILKDDQKTEKEITRLVTFTDVHQQSQSNKLPRIRNFYTRSKKYSPEINLYASVDNYREGLRAVIDSYLETKQTNVTENNVKFSAKIAPGKNLFFLKLLEGENLLDVEELIIYMNDSESMIIEDNIEYQQPNMQDTAGNGQIQISGAAVGNEILFVSSSQKAKALILPLICILFILVTIALLKLKFQSKII